MSRAGRAATLMSVVGAILGTQTNRQLSIVNTFEIRLLGTDSDDSADSLDVELLQSRRDQCKPILPSLLMASSSGVSHSRHYWLVLKWRYPYLVSCVYP